jgi:NADPH-dependent ferric siderophore reductase
MHSMPTEYLTATVLRTTQITPNVVRLTFSVPGFRSTGAPDEWVHIFLGEPGDHSNRRNYTIRKVRDGEVDVDVVLHERGLMVDWTRAAAPGGTLVWGEVTGSEVAPADTDWWFLAGDITALPAIGRIVEELPKGARATVVAETGDPADRQEWESQGEVEYVWMQGGEASKLEHAVRTFPEPEGNGYRFMAGETRAVRATRRHLRHELGIPKERWSLTGYWLDNYEAWEARYQKVAAEMEALWVEGEAQGRDVEDIMDDYDEAL